MIRYRASHLLLVVSASICITTPLHAAPAPRPVAPGQWVLLSATATFNLGLLVAQPRLAPTQCHWCEVDAQGHSTLNRFDSHSRDALRWHHPVRAHHLSNGIALLALPLASFGASALAFKRDDWHDPGLARDVWQIAQAASFTLLLNQVVKLSVARERPFVHAYRVRGERLPYRSSAGDRLSFFSGHSALTFALATSASVVATRRIGAQAAWVWSGSMLCAATTGWLRIAADKHYASDVLSGAIIGSAVGLGMTLIPRAYPSDSNVAVELSQRFVGMHWAGRF